MMSPRTVVAFFFCLLLAGLAWAVPPVEPLDRALARAELVVVGKLGKLTPIEGTHQATGEIAVTQVLKGPADLKTVTLQTVAPGQQVVGPVFRHEGDEGIWILSKRAADGQARYVAIGPSNLQPLTALDEVKRILKEQGTLAGAGPASRPATAPAAGAAGKIAKGLQLVTSIPACPDGFLIGSPADVPGPVPPLTSGPSAIHEREIARLVGQLGDDDFQVRDAATRKLQAMPLSSRALLEKFQKETRDEEVRLRLAVVRARLSLWDGTETVAQYARRMEIKETERTVHLANKVTMSFVLIPAGEFLMGGAEDDKDRSVGESQHRVTLTRAFLMGVTEVTRAQFGVFVRETGYKTEAEGDGKGGWGWTGSGVAEDPKYTWRNPGFEQGDDHPVVNVSCHDVQAFCEWLGKKAGKKYRLPTEAEWEYSCRAGTTTAYGWGNDADGGKGWCNGADQTGKETLGDAARDWSFFGWRDGYAFTAPVGKFKANAWRLHDMHGNVWEWCSDWYGAYPEGETTDPTGPNAGESRVLRGGGWYYGSPQFCRSAYRLRATPGSRNGCCLGFRLVQHLSG